MKPKAPVIPPALLTVGHSNRQLADFLHLLDAHSVKLIVDVRTIPRSRHNPQFNRDTLPKDLREVGIDYAHMPALGGLRHRQPNSPNTAWENASFQGYADYMQTPAFEKGLQELLRRVSGKRGALMCAEALPWRCHRSLIADALVARGLPVEHILTTSRKQPHVLRDWAHVEGTTITYPST